MTYLVVFIVGYYLGIGTMCLLAMSRSEDELQTNA